MDFVVCEREESWRREMGMEGGGEVSVLKYCFGCKMVMIIE